MTPPPPPLITPRPQHSGSTLLAWLIIAACVALVVIRNDRAAQLAEKDGDPIAPLQLKCYGRMVVGIKSAIKLKWGMAPLKQNLKEDKLIDSMDKLATSADDKLKVAIIAGEINGADQAMARLEGLAKADNSPELTQDIATLRAIYQNGVGSLDPPARASLAKHQGYFGQVALAYGVADDREPRQSLEQAGVRFIALVALAGLGILLLLLASFVCFILAIVFIASGKIRRAYVPDPAASSAYLEAFALYLVVFIAFGFVVRQFNLDILHWEWLALLIIPLAMYWTARRGATAAQRQNAFGWIWGRGPHIEIPLGIAGYLACLPIEFLGVVISARLAKMADAHPTHPILRMLDGDIWHVLAIYGLACGLAPVLEETMFRGALFHHLRRRWGWFISALVVAFIFAIIHPQGWTLVPALGSFALVVAALREWRGSILAPMAAHAFSNFVVVSMAMLFLR